MQKIFYLFIFIIPLLAKGQTDNYWSRNFNEESSLLSGAVVGGGAGASAIFYNPASISEIEESKLSLNASLFSYEVLNSRNALGDDIDFYDSRSYVIPRFFSYMFKLKKHLNWSLEVAFLNNANFLTESTNFIDKNIDILTHEPGVERYTSFSKYSNKARDDWFGVGGSYNLNDEFVIGTSMFVSAKTNEYSYAINIEAGTNPNDVSTLTENPYFSAKYNEEEYLKFNDYRLLWKFGLLYKVSRFSVGLNFTTPSIGNIYSDGKKLFRRKSQYNISDPETGKDLPNYFITDYKEKKEVNVNSKTPLSVALGLTYYNPDKTKTLYLTAEYFAKIDPYRMVETEESDNLADGTIFETSDHNEWLTFINGARSVFNAAVGYRWILNENLMILAGFRTDFNHKKNVDFNPYVQEKTIKSFVLDKYHITSGLTINILGHDFITGFQYTLGHENGQKQYVNLSDPIEFNYEEMKALQGTRDISMQTILNSVSLYFGATINFGE
ncbi:MAG: hypothetical protein KAH68_00045 [Draconibacterium sp.]|nr:hypothetical protein [Draconibacterium sp.]